MQKGHKSKKGSKNKGAPTEERHMRMPFSAGGGMHGARAADRARAREDHKKKISIAESGRTAKYTGKGKSKKKRVTTKR